jgi:RimJ/RimL family protein N-acetyltransferase
MDPRSPERCAKLMVEVNKLSTHATSEANSHCSLYGPSKTYEDTEKALTNLLPVPYVEGEDKVYRIAYAVHELLDPTAVPQDDMKAQNSRFIGLITLRTLAPSETTFPPRDGHASTATTLSLEVAYMFLPTSWGKGYATESIRAVFDACARAKATFWAPYAKVLVRAIVNDENRPSQRVMEKCDMGEPEVIEFEGGRFFIAGKWRTKHRLFVYGKEVVV